MQIDLAYGFVHNGIYFLQLGAAATQGDGGSATLALYSNSREVFVHLDLAYGFGYNEFISTTWSRSHPRRRRLSNTGPVL